MDRKKKKKNLWNVNPRVYVCTEVNCLLIRAFEVILLQAREALFGWQ